MDKSIVALGHVWKEDQSVVVVTNKDTLLQYYPLKNSCKLLKVASASKKLRKRKSNQNGEEGGEDSDGSEELSGEDEVEDEDEDEDETPEETLFEAAAIPAECVAYSKDLIIAAGRVVITFH